MARRKLGDGGAGDDGALMRNFCPLEGGRSQLSDTKMSFIQFASV